MSKQKRLSSTTQTRLKIQRCRPGRLALRRNSIDKTLMAATISQSLVLSPPWIIGNGNSSFYRLFSSLLFSSLLPFPIY
uniref:Uncharacterized protein n=1 Tax=Cucumis melo TaxID=3656 RepID=A0A9I9EFA7_CUCME